MSKHYIRINSRNLITSGLSDELSEPQNDDILINKNGGRQFRLKFQDGTLSKENASLVDDNGIYLYKFDGKFVQKRPQAEIDSEMATINLESARQEKIQEFNQARENTINSGVEVTTSLGKLSFSLTDRDQLNLNASYGGLIAALAGMPSPVDLTQGVWYHADGQPHRFWSKEDFTNICLHAFPFIAQTIVYYKALVRHIHNLMTEEEIKAAFWGMEVDLTNG